MMGADEMRRRRIRMDYDSREEKQVLRLLARIVPSGPDTQSQSITRQEMHLL